MWGEWNHIFWFTQLDRFHIAVGIALCFCLARIISDCTTPDQSPSDMEAGFSIGLLKGKVPCVSYKAGVI